MTLRSPDGRTEVALDFAAGGRLVSLRRDGAELLFTATDGDPMLTGCYPMAPWAGRVRSGVFQWNGTSMRLPIAAPPHAIHGVVHDVEWLVAPGDPGAATVQFDARWPLRGSARQSVRVTDAEVVCRCTVTAGNETMPVVLGYHPCFARRLGDGRELSVDVRPDWMWRRDDQGIITGERVDPPPGPWDDAFGGITVPPRLQWTNGPALEMHSSHDVWVVFDELDDVVCVEPQTAPPDAFNTEPAAPPSDRAAVLAPGESLTLEMRLRWIAPTPC